MLSAIQSILPIILYAIYGAVCFQLTNCCLDDSDDIRLSSCYHQIGNIDKCHCLELGYETIVYGAYIAMIFNG